MSTNSSHRVPPPTTCFSAVFRRLLCAGSLPTHPSDQFPNNSEAENYSKPQAIMKQGTGSRPGVVAKLMGLDLFPDTPSWVHKDGRRSLGSFLRSRSANSIDFLAPARQHRRARTSVSFREGLHYPDYVSMVSILEKVDEIGGCEEKRGGSECIEKLRDRKVIRKKIEPRNDLHVKKRVILLREKKAAGIKTESKRPKMKDKMHSGSSWVHPSQIIIPAVSGREHSRRNVRSQTAQSRSSTRYTNKADSRNDEETINAISRKLEKREKIIRNNKRSACYYKRMVEIICGMTEASIYENWTNDGAMEKCEDFEEYICKWVGQEILEGLLEDFVDETTKVIDFQL